jgi:ribosome maturation factor RimP
MDIGSKVKLLIEKEISNVGLILDSCEYLEENKIKYLRITIDKEPNATLEDCVLVNNIVNPIIEELPYLEESYILDVTTKEKGNK